MDQTVSIAPHRHRQPHILILVLFAAINPLAINIFVPSMPGMAGEFGVPYATIQLGMSLYLATTALVTLAAGPLSDHFGRRPVIIGGLVLFMAGTALTLVSNDITVFLTGRVIQAGSATGMVLSRAIVRDLYERDRAASMIGYVTMGMSVAPMIGPAVGGILDDLYGWRASFQFLGALGAMALLVTAARLPETNHSRGRPLRQQMAIYRELITSSSFWWYAGAGSLSACIFFGFLGGAPAIASNHLSMSASAYGIWFAVCAAGYMAGNFVSGRFSQRLGIPRMITMGALFALAGGALPLALLGFGQSLWPVALFGPSFLIGVGNGMVMPNATAAAVSVKPEAAGTASGLMGAMQVGAGALASIICSIAASDGNAVMAFGVTLAVIAGFATLISLKAAAMARRA